jgi:hypothetical protein
MWKKILFFPKSFKKPHFDIKQIFLGVGYSMTIQIDSKDGIGYPVTNRLDGKVGIG